MKKLTKSSVLFDILHFGRLEQLALIEQGKHHEAYQIEHARNKLHCALLEHGIKGVRALLPLMTEYKIDADGCRSYAPLHFVHDANARALLKAFGVASGLDGHV